MRAHKPSDKIFTRRAFVVGGLQATALAVLGGRLAWLQVSQGGRYKTLSDKNRIDIEVLAPIRGEVLDINGKTLAGNERSFSLLIDASKTNDFEKVIKNVQGIVFLTDDEVKAILGRLNSSNSKSVIKIKSFLSWEEVARVSVRLPDFPSLSIVPSYIRHYPLDNAFAHVVGYVGAVSKSDLAASNKSKLLTLPDFKIGKTGIERAQDKALRGQAGSAQVEVDARGRKVREIGKLRPTKGLDVSLTVHAELQKDVMRLISRQKSASAVVLDVNSGAVYSMVSHPSFNPNEFVTGLSAAKWEGLLANAGHPMTNKAIAGLYPPASTFKMITALAALEAGVIDKNTRVTCNGYYNYGGHRFHCWKASGHGSMNLVSALEQSCDTFFYDLAPKLGIEALASMARRFGIGMRHDVGLKEEGVGLMPDKHWKMGAFGTPWRNGESILASIGQGYIQATPLQMALMAARIANPDMLAISPFVVGDIGVRSAAKRQTLPLDVNKKHLDLVRYGMGMVMNGAKGTARKSQVFGRGWQIAGKTGTAQVRRITAKQRADGVLNKDLAWEARNHALFVGYAPIEKPRYACCVVVEHGGGGSSTAAPIARDILIKTMKYAP